MTDISRRSFFKRFATATAAALIATQVNEDILGVVSDDPERRIWIPGAKKIIDLGARPLITPAPAEIKTLSDEELAAVMRQKVDEIQGENHWQTNKYFGVGRVARTQRLAMVTSGGYGEFTIVDGRLQGGPEVEKHFRDVDVAWGRPGTARPSARRIAYSEGYHGNPVYEEVPRPPLDLKYIVLTDRNRKS